MKYLAMARVRFVWILDERKDLLFYIGSALAGWLYVSVIFYAAQTLPNPLHDALATVRFAGMEIRLTLEALVFLSWAFLLDAPHIWATLGRTFFDPEEWHIRRREILFSLIWFVVGPAAILLPYFAGATLSPMGLRVPAAALPFGAISFFIFFRLWAYYHVVRQHWGFFSLYKRKAGDFDGGGQDRIDKWFFNLSLYLPLAMFLTSPFYGTTPGYTDLGLRRAIAGGLSAGEILYPLFWAAYLVTLIGYLGYIARLWFRGAILNGSKLLYLFLIVPLHFIAFSHPIMAVFLVPVVTVGHNIQYHCIVYHYAQNKYKPRQEPQYRWVKGLFKNFGTYAVVGLLFTFAFYRGPWIGFLKNLLGLELDKVLLNTIGMMAGIRDPAQLGLGEQAFAGFILGFAMQHYYFDSKIWRVSKDKTVARYLRV